MNPNPTQIGGLVRAALAWGFGYLGLTGGWVETTIAIGGAIGVAIWSLYSNKVTTMIEAVAKDEAVHEVVVEPAIANKIPSEKVVPIP